MKILFIIIKEELFKIKNQILAVTIFNIITPLILYLSFSIPLSAVFTNLKPIYGARLIYLECSTGAYDLYQNIPTNIGTLDSLEYLYFNFDSI